jgi:hypothetical protein
MVTSSAREHRRNSSPEGPDLYENLHHPRPHRQWPHGAARVPTRLCVEQRKRHAERLIEVLVISGS